MCYLVKSKTTFWSLSHFLEFMNFIPLSEAEEIINLKLSMCYKEIIDLPALKLQQATEAKLDGRSTDHALLRISPLRI